VIEPLEGPCSAREFPLAVGVANGDVWRFALRELHRGDTVPTDIIRALPQEHLRAAVEIGRTLVARFADPVVRVARPAHCRMIRNGLCAFCQKMGLRAVRICKKRSTCPEKIVISLHGPRLAFRAAAMTGGRVFFPGERRRPFHCIPLRAKAVRRQGGTIERVGRQARGHTGCIAARPPRLRVIKMWRDLPRRHGHRGKIRSLWWAERGPRKLAETDELFYGRARDAKPKS